MHPSKFIRMVCGVFIDCFPDAQNKPEGDVNNAPFAVVVVVPSVGMINRL